MRLPVAFAAAALAAACAMAEEFTAASEGGKPRSATVAVDFAAACGPVKPMNAVNNGPVGGSADSARHHGNFLEYRAARIPFARTHDAAEYIVYGGDHVADITAMFPNFDADENDPKSYDFAVTDAYLRNMRAAGTEPFFRLGQRIEHAAKRYNVWPPNGRGSASTSSVTTTGAGRTVSSGTSSTGRSGTSRTSTWTGGRRVCPGCGATRRSSSSSSSRSPRST